MNQQFENSEGNSPDDFEKRLSAFSLVDPTEEYARIPVKLRAVVPTLGSRRWQWITAGALVGMIVALAITLNDSAYRNSIFENQIDNTSAAMYSADLPNNQPNLAGVPAIADRFISGKHYAELTNQLDMSDSTAIEVVAFFWYPCWPCSEFEEYLTAWESELGNGITLTRMPAIWSSEMRFHASAYFTALELGVLERSHREFYIAFNKDNPTVTNEEELQQFFETFGISAAEFLRAYHSETTVRLLNNAEEQNRAYQIQSTPSMFVAGKYGISPQGDGGFEEMLEVADFLIEGL